MSETASGAARNARRVPQKTALLILGMHRSGTSALTGLLGQLGVDLGPTLIAGRIDNPLGFFEHADIVTLNDTVLAETGSSWDDPCFDPAIPQKLKHWLQSSIETVITKDFSRSDLYAIKDPRVCRFPEIYLHAMRRTDAAVIQIVALRSPREVCHSLLSRNGIDIDRSAWLWLRHTIAAVKSAGCTTASLVFYDRLLAEPEFEAGRMLRLIGMPDEIMHGSRQLAKKFIMPGLKHHNHDDDFGVPPTQSAPLLAAQNFFSALTLAQSDNAVALALQSAEIWTASNSDETVYRAYLQKSFLRLSESVKDAYASKQSSYPIRYFTMRLKIKLMNLLVKNACNARSSRPASTVTGPPVIARSEATRQSMLRRRFIPRSRSGSVTQIRQSRWQSVIIRHLSKYLNETLARSEGLSRNPQALTLMMARAQKKLFGFPH